MKDLTLKQNFSFSPEHFSNQMAIEIEARHKALNEILKKQISNKTLVIEIAAGLSPRRLQFENYNYAELDFKPVMDIKKEIYHKLGKSDESIFSVDLADTTAFKNCLTNIIKTKNFDNVIVLN